MTDPAKLEKVAMLALAGGALVVLAVVAIKALNSGTLDANAAGMLGVIVTGLIAFLKDIVTAIRGYSMSAQLGKVTDQLAASGPVPSGEPQEVVVTNAADAPVPVESR